MKKKTEKKPEPTIWELAETVAENNRIVYETFLRKGFTTEQAFQLLLSSFKGSSLK